MLEGVSAYSFKSIPICPRELSMYSGIVVCQVKLDISPSRFHAATQGFTVLLKWIKSLLQLLDAGIPVVSLPFGFAFLPIDIS
jgi:hypothetical protein